VAFLFPAQPVEQAVSTQEKYDFFHAIKVAETNCLSNRDKLEIIWRELPASFYVNLRRRLSPPLVYLMGIIIRYHQQSQGYPVLKILDRPKALTLTVRDSGQLKEKKRKHISV